MNNSIFIFLFIFINSVFSNEYNLETCETYIANDVPIFFQKYFHCVTIKLSETENYVNIYFNNLPPYKSWYYPSDWLDYTHSNSISIIDENYIQYQSQGAGYYKNPGTLAQQNFVISIPINPIPIENHQIAGNAVDGILGTDSYEYPMGTVGLALNGISLFGPLASPPDIIEDEIFSFDLYNGHPAGNTYHYHTTTPGPLEVLEKKLPNEISSTIPGTSEIELYGIMCDGTLVLGCTELNRSLPNFSTLDCQNGHIHDIYDENGILLFENRYHTHICYNSLSESDNSGNGCEDHEFTPEVAYYQSLGTGMNANVCSANDSPLEADKIYSNDDFLNNKEIFLKSSGFRKIFPNPFNSIINISYELKDYDKTNISIINIKGDLIIELVDKYELAGIYNIVWDASKYSSGIYFVTIRTKTFSNVKKIIYLK